MIGDIKFCLFQPYPLCLQCILEHKQLSQIIIPQNQFDLIILWHRRSWGSKESKKQVEKTYFDVLVTTAGIPMSADFPRSEQRKWTKACRSHPLQRKHCQWLQYPPH